MLVEFPGLLATIPSIEIPHLEKEVESKEFVEVKYMSYLDLAKSLLPHEIGLACF
jgi:hypothetical protein